MQETSVACYILVVECVLLSHTPYSPTLMAQKQQYITTTPLGSKIYFVPEQKIDLQNYIGQDFTS